MKKALILLSAIGLATTLEPAHEHFKNKVMNTQKFLQPKSVNDPLLPHFQKSVTTPPPSTPKPVAPTPTPKPVASTPEPTPKPAASTPTPEPTPKPAASTAEPSPKPAASTAEPPPKPSASTAEATPKPAASTATAEPAPKPAASTAEPTKSPPSQPTSQQTSGTSSSHWFLWTLLVLVILAAIAGGIYAYAKYKQRQIYVQYSQNPEAGIPKQELGLADKIKYAKWKINDDPEKGAKNVRFEGKQNQHGDYFELKFTQPNGTINTVIANHSIQDKEHSYFEVEIDDNPKQCDVVIGYCYDKEYGNNLELGKSVTSIAFHSMTGAVEYANKELYNYGFSAVYGETLGMGMRWSDGRVFLSYNGRFLNPTPKSEVKPDSDEEDAVAIQLDPKEKKVDDDMKKRKIVIQNKKPLFPAISTNGPVKVNVNIGGQPFRMSQKELRHGLL